MNQQNNHGLLGYNNQHPNTHTAQNLLDEVEYIESDLVDLNLTKILRCEVKE